MKTRFSIATASMVWVMVGALSVSWAQDPANADLMKKLNRPATYERGIPFDTSVKDFLDSVSKKFEFTIEIDKDSFKSQGGAKEIEKEKVGFDKSAGIRLGMVLELVLKQAGATYEAKNGVLRIIPISPGKMTVFEPLDATEKDRRVKETRKKLSEPVNLEKGLEKMTFGEARDFFADRYDINIIIDFGAFPKKAGEKSPDRRKVELEKTKDVSLLTILKLLTQQIRASFEIRAGTIVIIPQKDE